MELHDEISDMSVDSSSSDSDSEKTDTSDDQQTQPDTEPQKQKTVSKCSQQSLEIPKPVITPKCKGN